MKSKIILLRSTTLLFFSLITIFSSPVYAQSDTVPDTRFRRHELGIDVIGLVRMFPNIGGSLDFWSPNYLFTYRYHFKRSNLRMGIGGTGSADEFKIYDPGSPTERYAQGFFGIDFRIGYEGFTNIGKKWQVFYGVDVRPSFLYSSSEYSSDATNIVSCMELFAHQYGVAPVLGFRFKPTQRISIVLESSIAFNGQFANIRDYDIIDGYEIENFTSPRNRFFVSYYQPVSLSFTFDL